MKNNSKLEHGKIYLGHTYNANFIGKYNQSTEKLERVMSVNMNGANIQIAPAIHPIFLTKKFENKLNDVDIPMNMFISITDPDKIEYGTEFVKVYNEACSNIILEEGELSDEQVADKIKKAIEEKEKNNGLKIIQ